MHCLHYQGLKTKQQLHADWRVISGRKVMNICGRRTLYHLLKSWNLSFTLICKSLTDVMPLLLSFCNCQLSNKTLVLQLSWRMGQNCHEAALDHSSVHTLRKQDCWWSERRKPNPPHVKPGAERKQRPNCDKGQEVPEEWSLSSISRHKKKSQPKPQKLHSKLLWQ